PEIAGGTLTSFERPVINDEGSIAFLVSVRRSRDLADAIFLLRRGVLRKVAGAGDNAPGGGVFSGFGTPAVNNRRAVAFSAVVDPAPGGGRFAGFLSPPTLSPGGTICFVASIDGGSSPVAVYLAGRSGLQRLAGIGDALPDGSRLTGFPRYPTVAIGPDDAVT